MVTKPKVLGQWIELYEGMMSDKPPHSRKYEFYLFINHVNATETAKGRFVVRVGSVIRLESDTRNGLHEKLDEYVKRHNVRLLKPSIECNDDSDVPRREPLTDSLFDGSDEIYADKWEITSNEP